MSNLNLNNGFKADSSATWPRTECCYLQSSFDADAHDSADADDIYEVYDVEYSVCSWYVDADANDEKEEEGLTIWESSLVSMSSTCSMVNDGEYEEEGGWGRMNLKMKGKDKEDVTEWLGCADC